MGGPEPLPVDLGLECKDTDNNTNDDPFFSTIYVPGKTSNPRWSLLPLPRHSLGLGNKCELCDIRLKGRWSGGGLGLRR